MLKKQMVLILVCAALVLWLPSCGIADDGRSSPKVIATQPMNGTTDVDPALTMIKVTFSKTMMDKSWSWSYEDKGSFPQTAGQPYYTDNGKTCVLPVKLEPGKQYVIWINTARFGNFKDRGGNPAEPYKLTFTTRKK